MNILILGLGQYPKGSGIAAAFYFAKKGNQVIATDLKTRDELKANVVRLKKFKNVRFALGGHNRKDVQWADLIVRNPRVRKDSPEMVEAGKRGLPIESDLSIFMRACPCQVVGITGTRGKSTTTMLIHQILSASKKWRKVWLGGNILVSPLTFLDEVTSKDIVVLEMSSWQLEATGDAGVSPQIAVWTNLMRDHLNTYSSMEEYAEAKAQIFRHQKPEDVVFLPDEKDFDEYAKEAPGDVIRVRQKAKIALGVPGEHNQRNAQMAAAVATHLGIKTGIISKVLKGFHGLDFRQQIISVKSGVTIVNDSTATTPDATIAAIETFRKSQVASRKVHLLFGGNDKELMFDEVAKEIKKNKVNVYLLPGNAKEKIEAAFQKAKVAFHTEAGLREAIRDARKDAKKGDCLLLSPGCTSFGEFKNEFDRGETFNKLVKKYV